MENFQTLISTSLNSIISDVKIQYENMKDELLEQIDSLNEQNLTLSNKVEELSKKIEESNFTEENFNRVSIISNLNNQIKQLQNENSDLRNCLNKNIPLNQSLARTSTPNIEDNESSENNEIIDEVVENNDSVQENSLVTNETSNIVEENHDEEESITEIEHKGKTYYLIGDELYNKRKNGNKGKCAGKMVNGKPKINKKKKKNVEN